MGAQGSTQGPSLTYAEWLEAQRQSEIGKPRAVPPPEDIREHLSPQQIAERQRLAEKEKNRAQAIVQQQQMKKKIHASEQARQPEARRPPPIPPRPLYTPTPAAPHLAPPPVPATTGPRPPPGPPPQRLPVVSAPQFIPPISTSSGAPPMAPMAPGLDLRAFAWNQVDNESDCLGYGYRWDANRCDGCPPGQQWNPDSNLCVSFSGRPPISSSPMGPPGVPEAPMAPDAPPPPFDLGPSQPSRGFVVTSAATLAAVRRTAKTQDDCIQNQYIDKYGTPQYYRWDGPGKCEGCPDRQFFDGKECVPLPPLQREQQRQSVAQPDGRQGLLGQIQKGKAKPADPRAFVRLNATKDNCEEKKYVDEFGKEQRYRWDDTTNKCEGCPVGQFFDGKKCVPKEPTKATTKAAPQEDIMTLMKRRLAQRRDHIEPQNKGGYSDHNPYHYMPTGRMEGFEAYGVRSGGGKSNRRRDTSPPLRRRASVRIAKILAANAHRATHFEKAEKQSKPKKHVSRRNK